MEFIEILKEFIKPEMFILIPVMYLIGMGLKKSVKFKDELIPFLLGIICVVLCATYMGATTTIKTTQDVFMFIFISITQGILIAGAGVYVNQLFKQVKKGK